MKTESVFFVSGAANGIGARTCELIVEAGHRVVVSDVDEDAANTLRDRLGEAAIAVALDVREPEAWRQAMDKAWGRFGGVDVLVNNAGLIHGGWVGEHSAEQIDHMIQVNLVGVINGVRAALPRLEAQGHGHIITIASLVAFMPLKGQVVYSATKHAVRAFHHGVAQEAADGPVTFSLVCPGAVDTDMLRRQIDKDSNAIAFADTLLTPEQVAEAIYRAARDKPRELLIPRWQGAALRVVGANSGLVANLVTIAEKRGLKRLRVLRSSQK